MLRALARLSERDRETILLVAWDGLATAQAARVLGVRARTFDARLYRARKRLAAVLGEEQSEAATLHPLIERRV